jgi:hypothetical protein
MGRVRIVHVPARMNGRMFCIDFLEYVIVGPTLKSSQRRPAQNVHIIHGD